MDALTGNLLMDQPAEFLSDVRDDLSAVSRANCEALLRSAGLKSTRQRIMLADLLFSGGNRHVTAEQLYHETVQANMQLSLATVYNTLNQFTEAGLLQRIGADGTKSFFDTNPTIHPHFYIEDEDILIDIPERLVFEQVPDALPGYDVARLDVIVHLRRKPNG